MAPDRSLFRVCCSCDKQFGDRFKQNADDRTVDLDEPDGADADAELHRTNLLAGEEAVLSEGRRALPIIGQLERVGMTVPKKQLRPIRVPLSAVTEAERAFNESKIQSDPDRYVSQLIATQCRIPH